MKENKGWGGRFNYCKDKYAGTSIPLEDKPDDKKCCVWANIKLWEDKGGYKKFGPTDICGLQNIKWRSSIKCQKESCCRMKNGISRRGW